METVLGVDRSEAIKVNLRSPSFEAYYQTLSEEEKEFFNDHPAPKNWEETAALSDQMTEETRYQYHFGIFEAWLLLHTPDYYNLTNDQRIKLAADREKAFINHYSRWHLHCRFAFDSGNLRELYNELSNDQLHALLVDFWHAEKRKQNGH